MKLRQLHINRFGHFSDCDLVFPANGMQVIYGPNEAGKTTLLEFLRGLLFDFPVRTAYDFGGQGEIAGVGTLELRDGRVVELRRRKGNKDKVAIKVDGQPTELDDSGWLRMLDHADRGLFESIFAFGLDQLSQGETSLKHERVQSALFGGSLGGTSSPDRIIAELSRQADELFKKGARTNPRINALLAELSGLRKEIKTRSLWPDKYREADAALAKASERARETHERVDHLRREHSKCVRQVRAWPKWWELQQRRAARSKLTIPESLPSDARQRFLAIGRELKAVVDKQAICLEEIKGFEQGLLGLQLDPGAVSYRAEIKACVELRQSFIEAREQLPERQRQREAVRMQVDRELTELRPGWGHDDLRAFSVDIATRAMIDRLDEERRTRVSSVATLTAKRESDSANLRRMQEELAELGPPRDVSMLVAVLAAEADFVANQKRLESGSVELTKLERQLAAQCRRLVPPLSDATPVLQELPVPRVETVVDFETQFADVRDRLRAATASIEEDEATRRVIESSMATAMSKDGIPSLSERDDARRRRDAGWNLIRRQYLESEQVDSEISKWLGESDVSLPDGYEQTVGLADHISDQIYDHANEVAEREGLRRQLAAVDVRLGNKRQRLAGLEQERAELEANWVSIWRACGFEPLAPDAMLSWLKDYEAACALISERDDLIENQSQLEKQVESFRHRLQSACGRNDADDLELIAYSRQLVDDVKTLQRKSEELLNETRRLDRLVTGHDAELQKISTRETLANAEWAEVLDRLKLPAEWDTELARTVIDRLNTTRVRLDGLPGEDARIAAMQARISEFDRRVGTLCQGIAPELLRNPTEIAVKKLDDQVERAVEAQRSFDGFTQRLGDSRSKLESLNRHYDQYDSERRGLIELAHAATDVEFLEAVGRAETATQLDDDIGKIERELELTRAGDDPEEFEQSLSNSEFAVLQGQERDLSEALKSADADRKAADGEEAVARSELLRLDGTAAVATLTEELSRRRSLLESEVDRYMPLIYAKHILNTAVTRFEKNNQPEMIITVSRLLSEMTGGKYVEFDRTGGSRPSILIRRADGVERTPEQLSTGTREQLYLAIRLAYVLHYCEKNQPLPIIFDDVLANFDPQRARQTFAALVDISNVAQVLFFTCHPHMVAIASDVVPGLSPIQLSMTDSSRSVRVDQPHLWPAEHVSAASLAVEPRPAGSH